MENKRDIKQAVDTICDKLIVAIGEQLLEAVNNGEKLREAIDWIKLHKRSVTEHDVLGGSRNPSEYLDSLVGDILEDESIKVRR